MSALRIVAVAAAALLASAQPTPVNNACQFKYNDPNNGAGATFNVCSLASAADYVWTDPTDAETANSTYYFNIGVNVQHPPAVCGSKTAPAFQIDNSNLAQPLCYGLGLDITNKLALYQTTLLDVTNPAKGFQLAYNGGEICAATGASRSFAVQFHCFPAFPFPPSNNSVLNSQAFVNEEQTCSYSGYSWSMSGCPLECPVVGGVMCGGNGVCGYDSTIGTARCFCYSDWIEADCQTPRTTFPAGAVAGAVIGGIILGAAILLGVSFWMGRSAAAKAASHAGAGSIQEPRGFYE